MTYPAAGQPALNLVRLSATMGYCWWCGKWSQVRNALCAECHARRVRH
jgi:hypothetical protein